MHSEGHATWCPLLEITVVQHSKSLFVIPAESSVAVHQVALLDSSSPGGKPGGQNPSVLRYAVS